LNSIDKQFLYVEENLEHWEDAQADVEVEMVRIREEMDEHRRIGIERQNRGK
jgi:frataxin-like iron-binding protein CyaY